MSEMQSDNDDTTHESADTRNRDIAVPPAMSQATQRTDTSDEHNRWQDYAAGELLQKFGLGEHKPGSGSAAAHQAMLSAMLTKTVIHLSLDPKRQRRYGEWRLVFEQILEDIETDIYPQLDNLFQEDSDQFHKVIVLREQRDAESDPAHRHKLSMDALAELRPATEIPITIGQLSARIASHAVRMFDIGFQSARGDSAAAINAGISALASCLCIIDLNLTSLPNDEWASVVTIQADELRNELRELRNLENNRRSQLEREVALRWALDEELSRLRADALGELSFSTDTIESLATRLQYILWDHRDILWKSDEPTEPLDVLKPELALRKMGYKISRPATLGEYEADNAAFEIAGIIDPIKQEVSISKRFTAEVQLFTGAHELGHAIMHNNALPHRDRPIDGSSSTTRRDQFEIEADLFAACFLMPHRQIRKHFRARFGTDQFHLNSAAAFKLGFRSVNDLIKHHPNLRSVSYYLASAISYDGEFFQSLAEQFRVSSTTMAIRIEELGIVKSVPHTA